ncbi:FAD-dependent oxidoreductase [Spartinivicinus poritis]|uniref:FAD-dependent oxidoreductase n=1 Tax=Spartinivicinus poritis TaxID=2994640 RepID=A0ABT5UDB4_9GAMM|nr:FAD-dependent oxidoreductase [Spartinivicinus sp. A2-2]MDE1464312.1 FAD-dependent oxidoreductase [Spartinivicinus sp. A2-2]
MREVTLDNMAEIFDAVVVGGGISGAGIYEQLARNGYRVLIIDKGDFSSGTSQASGMMVWGGLLYLKNYDFQSVIKFSKSRDKLINGVNTKVGTRKFRYLPLVEGGRSKRFAHSGLYLYWLMSLARRKRPYSESCFPEQKIINERRFKESLVYEEAGLDVSDSRFVLDRIAKYRSINCCALNYCSLQGASRKDGCWYLNLFDEHSGNEIQVKSKLLINAGGVWAEKIDDLVAIQSPYKHVFSKGVYLAFKRPINHQDCLVFEMGQHGDSQTFHPWGPVSLWGPTETAMDGLSGGFQATTEDVRFLLAQANQNLSMNYDAGDIVSLRCGIRPLAVKKSYQGNHYPLSLSRKHMVYHAKECSYISIYGGKLTSCEQMGKEVYQYVVKALGQPIRQKPEERDFEFNLDENHAPTPQWSMDNEYCLTLEDFLRRRSNISQWVHRGGMGIADANLSSIEHISKIIEKENAEIALTNYKNKIHQEYDKLLDSV